MAGDATGRKSLRALLMQLKQHVARGKIQGTRNLTPPSLDILRTANHLAANGNVRSFKKWTITLDPSIPELVLRFHVADEVCSTLISEMTIPELDLGISRMESHEEWNVGEIHGELLNFWWSPIERAKR